MTRILIEPHFLPSIEYFCALTPASRVEWEVSEHYVKQSYRNRCYINTAQGIRPLTIPLTQKHGKVLLREVVIDYSIPWQKQMWRTIESAYRKAPFFEHYSDGLKEILFNKPVFLIQLTIPLLSFCLRELHFPIITSETVTYRPEAEPGVYDFRSLISAKKPHSNRLFYQALPYYQVFGNTFAENLSVIDLLFCQGPQARPLLKASCHPQVNK
jgi:hypothetical protein